MLIIYLYIVGLCCLLHPLENHALEVSGQLKNLFSQSYVRTSQASRANLSRVRLQAEQAGESYQWSLSYDYQSLYGRWVQQNAWLLQAVQPVYVDLESQLVQNNTYDVRHGMYRLWFRWQGEHADITLGRQRIAWGSARIWNPSDRFQAVSVLALEPQEKLGTDALSARLQMGTTGELQAVFAPASLIHGAQQKAVVRWQGILAETDYSLGLGQIGSERFVTADFFSNVYEGGLFAEVMFARPRLSSTYWQLSTGYETTVVHTWCPRGLLLAFEFFYNSAANKAQQPRDALLSRAQQQLALRTAYDLGTLWRLDVFSILDLDQGSTAQALRLQYDYTANSTLLLQTWLFQGKKFSEFGNMKPIHSMQWMYFF